MMLKHPLHPNGEFHIDDNLFNNINELKRRPEMDKDNCGLIVGDSGNGKSTIASQIAFILNPDIIKERVYYTTVEDYIKYCMELKLKEKSKNAVIIHDEARETGGLNVLNSRIRTFWDFIFENRYLNMNQFFLQSDFFTTPKSIIKGRARFLIKVIEGERWQNGIFEFYGRKKLRLLYFLGKKLDNEEAVKPDFIGRFVSFFAGNPDYKNEKNNNFINKYKNIGVTNDKYNLLKRALVLDKRISNQIKADILNITDRQIYNLIHKYEVE